MLISSNLFQARPQRRSLLKTLMAAASFLATSLAQTTVAETPFNLASFGQNAVIEAEDYSRASEGYPHAEPTDVASGGQNLGYYWAGTWFEVDVMSSQKASYLLSLDASSPEGTTIDVFQIEEDGQEKPVAVIDVPPSHQWQWHDYQSVAANETFTLPAGNHTLRFVNRGSGVNVDYINAQTLFRNRIPSTVGPDTNPLKGFATGWQFDDQSYASVAHQYIEWGKFEPENNQFDWDYVHEVIEGLNPWNADEAHPTWGGSRGRHVTIQLVCDWDYSANVDDNYKGPQWLIADEEAGGLGVELRRGTASDGSREMTAIDYDNPVFIQQAQEAIDELMSGKLTGNGGLLDHPQVFMVQIGMLGFWGEWHTDGRVDWYPSETTKATILATYLDNLKNLDDYTQFRYPGEIEPVYGIGYTNGSAAPTEHGWDFGIKIDELGLKNDGPVGGEWPPGLETGPESPQSQKYFHRFFQTYEGLQFLFRGRYSFMKPPTLSDINRGLLLSGSNSNWQQDWIFDYMHKIMGYNFRVREVFHKVVLGNEEDQVFFETDLINNGIARFYKNWNVQLALLDAQTNEVISIMEPVSDLDISSIDSGESGNLRARFAVKLQQGSLYKIGLRILQPDADLPKSEPWGSLAAENVHVKLSNAIEVVPAFWDEDNALNGGWNVIGGFGR